MSDILSEVYSNGINPIDELDSIMTRSGFNVSNTSKKGDNMKNNTMTQYELTEKILEIIELAQSGEVDQSDIEGMVEALAMRATK